MRHFKGGAIRDKEEGKLDYEGCLSPAVLREFVAYMEKHRALPDGSKRGTDNWQAGIPKDVYMKSMWRHFMDVWLLHRGVDATRPEDGIAPDMTDALCGLLFNVMGYMFEELRDG